MAKALYFDCFSGAAGDMILGALIDLGVPLDDVRAALGSLAIDYGGISADRVVRSGIAATKFRVGEPGSSAVARRAKAGGQGARGPGSRENGTLPSHEHHHHHDHGHDHHHDHRSLEEITRLIGRSALSPAGKERAVHLFERLAQVEAAIHAMPVEKVHLHEVGAIDSIVDIVGCVYALEAVGAGEISASPLNVGGGTVRCAHGVMPVPAPATARLLQGAPVYSGEVKAELVTPTGALIVTGYATAFGPLPAMTITAAGYGAGDRDFDGHPNVIRIISGETAAAAPSETIVAIECEIDDMNPQLFGPLMDRLSEAGALDVFYTSVMMKKSRPGVLVTVLALPAGRDAICGVLFAETTTIGVRYQEMQREKLAREIRTIETPVGAIRFKIATRDSRVLNASPEFDDCARIAQERGIPIKDVQALAMKAWLDAR